MTASPDGTLRSQKWQQRWKVPSGKPTLTVVNNYDVIIVGGGAAGLSAALVLARARRSLAVLDAGEPRNAPAAHMHGYLSRDGFPPHTLLELGRGEVVGYGGEVLSGTVTDLYRTDQGFRVEVADAAPMTARRVLVTTGLRDEIPDVPGLRARWGVDVLHCPYCHGYEVRDQPLGVLGGTPQAVEHALLIRQWSDDVTFFPHTDALDDSDQARLAARGIRVATGEVAGVVVEDDHLTGVQLASGETVARAAVFVRPRLVTNDQLVTNLGAALTAHGSVAIDSAGLTSVPGLWIAGNAVNPRAQVITAAGEGSAAALAINNDLVTDDVARALRSSLTT
jgi:thioredoxin reductase